MQQIKLVLIAILAILAILLVTSNNTNPGDLTYGFKRLQEKVFLGLQFSPQQKLDYYDSLRYAATEENHKFLTDAINYLKEYIEKLSQVK